MPAGQGEQANIYQDTGMDVHAMVVFIIQIPTEHISKHSCSTGISRMNDASFMIEEAEHNVITMGKYAECKLVTNEFLGVLHTFSIPQNI
jgi:hypothetical protein